MLDTHVVVWLAFSPEKISRAATRAIAEARETGTGLSIAGVTLFEIAMLARRRRVDLELPLDSFLEGVESRFSVVPVNGNIAVAAAQLPASYPSDPMDRIIGATALIQGLPLITADEQIRRSAAVRVLW